MPQYIEVNGEVVEFPDDMSDDQIAQAIRGQDAPQRPPSIANVLAPKPKGVHPTSLGEYGRLLGGLGENALSMGSGLAAMIPAGLAGIGAAAIPGGKTGAEAVQDVQSALTYQPRLQEGQQIAEGLSRPAEALDTGLTDVFDTGNPLLSAGLRTGAEGLALLLPAGSATKAVRAASKPGQIIPKVNDLFNVGRVAFNEARLKGGSISDDALLRAARRVENITNDVGLPIRFDKDVHPAAFGARERIISDLKAGNVDFDNLMSLRELAGDVAGNADDAIAMRGMRLKNVIDDFVNDLKPEDIVGAGNPEQAAQALSLARNVWRDAHAARTIERIIDKANLASKTNFTSSGAETALRQRFRALMDRIIDGKEKGFTTAEVAAIRRVAEGTPLANLFREFGKFNPRGVLSAGAGVGMATILGGPLLGATVGAGGLLGRHLATRATVKNAEKALELPLTRSLLNP